MIFSAIVRIFYISLLVFTVSNPRLVLHRNKHMVQVKWTQTEQAQVIAFKLTNAAERSTVCTDVDVADYLKQAYGYKYCYELKQQKILQDITATDYRWNPGDIYFILQYAFTSHNAPYGPFVPH